MSMARRTIMTPVQARRTERGFSSVKGTLDFGGGDDLFSTIVGLVIAAGLPSSAVRSPLDSRPAVPRRPMAATTA